MNSNLSIMLDDNEHKMAKMIEDEWSTIFDTVETYEYRVMISKPDIDSVLFSNKCISCRFRRSDCNIENKLR